MFASIIYIQIIRWNEILSERYIKFNWIVHFSLMKNDGHLLISISCYQYSMFNISSRFQMRVLFNLLCLVSLLDYVLLFTVYLHIYFFIYSFTFHFDIFPRIILLLYSFQSIVFILLFNPSNFHREIFYKLS